MRRRFANRIFSRGKLDKAIGGNPSAPVDVINAVTHVFKRKWVKRDSDLNRFLANVYMLASVA